MRHVTQPNGLPVPEPYPEPAHFDISIYIAVAYLGEVVGSWLMSILLIWCMNSDAAMFGASNGGKCTDEIALETYVIGALSLVKGVLSSVVMTLMCFSESI